MWYNTKYDESIKYIKNYKKALLENEYRNIARDLDLLSAQSLRYISGTSFNQLVKQIRNKSA